MEQRITVSAEEFERRCGELMDKSQAENVEVAIESSPGNIDAIMYSGKVDILDFGDDEECPYCGAGDDNARRTTS